MLSSVYHETSEPDAAIKATKQHLVLVSISPAVSMYDGRRRGRHQHRDGLPDNHYGIAPLYRHRIAVHLPIETVSHCPTGC